MTRWPGLWAHLLTASLIATGLAGWFGSPWIAVPIGGVAGALLIAPWIPRRRDRRRV